MASPHPEKLPSPCIVAGFEPVSMRILHGIDADAQLLQSFRQCHLRCTSNAAAVYQSTLLLLQQQIIVAASVAATATISLNFVTGCF